MNLNDPLFLADLGLPGLAKHLRALGVDCVCDPNLTPGYMVFLADKDKRIVLTKSISLKNRIEQHNFRVKRDGGTNFIIYHWIEALGSKKQIMEVVNKFQIKCVKEKLFRKCVQCNGNVISIQDKQQIKGKVHDTVLDENENFAQCESCDIITYGTEDGNKIHQAAYDQTLKYYQEFSFKE